jgi:hypothetical protein
MMGVLDLEGMSIPTTSEDASSSFATDTTLRRQHVEYGTYNNIPKWFLPPMKIRTKK